MALHAAAIPLLAAPPVVATPGKEIPSEFLPTVAQLAMRKQIIEAIHMNARPFDRKVPDFSSLDAAISKARVVGIGQQTHGSQEIFQIQADLFRDLVQRHGVRTLLLEDDYGETARANDHVQGLSVDMEALTQGLFTIWRVREFGDLLAWMKAWNAQHPGDRVEIIGVDNQMRAIDRAITAALACLPAGEAKPWLAFADRMKPLLPSTWSRDWTGLALDEMVAARADADRLLRRVEVALVRRPAAAVWEPMLAARSILGALDMRIAILKGKKTRAGRDFPLPMPSAPALRDEQMASNVMLLMDLFPARKFAVWAHSLHTGKEGTTAWQPMGAMVASEKEPGIWCSVGIGTRGGTVTACEEGDYSKIGIGAPAQRFYKTFALKDAIPGAFEDLAENAGMGADLMVDFTRARGDGWLSLPLPFSMLGATINSAEPYQDAYFECRPAKSYDFYIFLNQPQATKVLDCFGK